MAKFRFGKGFDESKLTAAITTDGSSSSEYDFGDLHDKASANIAVHEIRMRYSSGSGDGKSKNGPVVAKEDDRRRGDEANYAELKGRSIFISYSRKDREWLQRLQIVLTPMVVEDMIKVWDDSIIEPGMLWREEITRALEDARVAVLLVSPDFLASRFIHEEELPILVGSAADRGTTVLWIPVKPSLVDRTAIGRYQAVISPDTPLVAMNELDRDRALVRIAEAVVEAAMKPLALQTA